MLVKLTCHRFLEQVGGLESTQIVEDDAFFIKLVCCLERSLRCEQDLELRNACQHHGDKHGKIISLVDDQLLSVVDYQTDVTVDDGDLG